MRLEALGNCEPRVSRRNSGTDVQVDHLHLRLDEEPVLDEELVHVSGIVLLRPDWECDLSTL